MAEVAPRVTYSEERVLEIRRMFGEEDIRADLDAHKEHLDSMSGYAVLEEDDDTVVRVDIDEVLGATPDNLYVNPQADELVTNLGRFGFGNLDHMSADDGVFGLDFWYEGGAIGVIYPRLQRWLNNMDLLDEDTARKCLHAMADPFGEEAHRQVEEDFNFRRGEAFVSTGIGGFSFALTSRREKFGVSKANENLDPPRYERGSVSWNWIDITTLGSCACWGPSGEEREHVYLHDDVSRLYEMGPHNIDFALQSLSLVLGMGVLAKAAAEYEGAEDILAEAEWQEEKPL